MGELVPDHSQQSCAASARRPAMTPHWPVVQSSCRANDAHFCEETSLLDCSPASSGHGGRRDLVGQGGGGWRLLAQCLSSPRALGGGSLGKSSGVWELFCGAGGGARVQEPLVGTGNGPHAECDKGFWWWCLPREQEQRVSVPDQQAGL